MSFCKTKSLLSHMEFKMIFVDWVALISYREVNLQIIIVKLPYLKIQAECFIIIPQTEE